AEAAVRAMTTLNKRAAEIAREVGGVHACTDVTGFGLLGHLYEMVAGAGLGARLESGAVPLLPGALELAARDWAPGGTERNLAHVSQAVTWDDSVEVPMRLALADAQTAGGLLFALPPDNAHRLVQG